MTNNNNTVLYAGVTNNIIRRMFEHKNAHNKLSFTTKYNITKLVYYEVFEDVYSAITREKQIKASNRNKKNSLINAFNPRWVDLYDEIATSLCSSQ
jgi:putative endonuclease